ncbi:MAG: S8 family serine peptidase [Flavobacteriales bacterium]|nr:S8 family serine peptidase [Flavobacteriales bacterium]
MMSFKTFTLCCLLVVTAPRIFSQHVESFEHYVPGELIVMIHPRTNVDMWCREFHEMGLTSMEAGERLSATMNLWKVQFDPTQMTADAALLQAERISSTQIVQLNHTNLVQRNVPDDELFEDQWALHNDGSNGGSGTADVDALQAWDLTTGGTNALGDSIVVAVIDGGFNINHEDLEANIFVNRNEIAGNGIDDDANGYIDDVNGWNAYTNSGTQSFSNHGTHVAGTIGAVGNNGIGVVGVNWNVKVMPISGSSSLEATVIAAYSYVLDMRRMYNETGGEKGAYVVSTNASFGVDYGDPADYPLWCAMYDSLGLVGILSAGATANLNVNIDVVNDVPTACGSNFLLSVTNTTSSDIKNPGAAYGATTIDLGAPGTNILSTTSNGYGNLTGTSMATPHVAGAVGLMHSAVCEEILQAYAGNPGGLAIYIRTQLLTEGVDELQSLASITVSGGRLNLFKAVKSVIDTCVSIAFEMVPSTCGNCDGSLIATVIGGEAPYQYFWSTNDTSNSISGLCPGTYTLTVVDAVSDSLIGQGVVSDSTGPVVSLSKADVTCNGGSDGNATLSGASSYLWSDGNTSSARNDLGAAHYFVTATNASSCSTVVEVDIDQPDSLMITFIGTVPTPYTGSNGVVSGTASGGVPPYSYAWNTGAQDSMVSGVEVGDYQLTVADANGCEASVGYYLGYPTGLNKYHADRVRLYPNPSDGSFFITGFDGEEVAVSIYDIMGRSLLSFNAQTDLKSIDLSSLQSGNYLVHLQTSTERIVKKVQILR